jgi:hypothetical protein
MNFTALVDVTIGVTLVYVGVSLFVSILSEFLSNLFSLRGKQLAVSLTVLFNKSGLKDTPAFRPLVYALDKAESYVDPHVLAQIVVAAVKDPAAPASGATGPIAANLLAGVDKLPDSQLKTALSTIARSTEAATEKIVKEVSDTIDRSLKVLGERYKKYMSRITLGLGFAVALAANIDTVSLVSTLYRDKELRDELVTTADQYIKKVTPELVATCPKLSKWDLAKRPECDAVLALGRAVKDRSGSIGKLPFGWANGFDWSSVTWSRLLGWLLTGFAASLGAPFWFDLLNRISNVRRVIARPEPRAPEASTIT